MPYLSQITIMGHAGREAECKQVGDTTCTTVSVAVSTRYKTKEGTWADRSTWWRVSVWGKQGEWLARDCRKGSLIVAAGEAEVREFEKKEGGKGWSAEIRATSCRVIAPKDNDQNGAEAAEPASRPAPTRPAAASTDDDNMPPF
jgi:single-strand DNA-binding protein